MILYNIDKFNIYSLQKCSGEAKNIKTNENKSAFKK